LRIGSRVCGMNELAVHPVAALFPMLADDEFEELTA
jgi:hypothetical protein